uniref:INO80 complex subunit E N-terminal domain-containing protein n=1 Tax=Monopterus albus TaxID=43700 RepID=A0A3Q3KGW5_MONAL
MNGQADVEVDYKRKYKNLKRKLKFLVYEQECFQEELRRAQRKLLKVSRDKSFLLDRLLQYERFYPLFCFVLSLTFIMAFLSLCCSFFCIFFVSCICVCLSFKLLMPVCMCLYGHLQNWACIYVGQMPFPPEYLAPSAERMKKERKTKTPKNRRETTGKVVTPVAANYPSAPAAPPASSGPFSWVPRQMLSGDAPEEDGESDGDSDRGDEDRGEGDEAELVIDIPNE